MSSRRSEPDRPSPRAVTAFVVCAIAAVPALFLGLVLSMFGAWVGHAQLWYGGPIFTVVGIGLSIGAGVYALSLGSIWGALLTGSPALLIGLAFFVDSGGPLFGLMFTPLAILLGILLVLTTEHRRRSEDEADAVEAVARLRELRPPSVEPSAGASGPSGAPAPAVPLTIVPVDEGDADPTAVRLLP